MRLNQNTQTNIFYKDTKSHNYGNNINIVSSSNIQGLKVNIYNYPILSYLSNRKISEDLIDYLNH